MVLEKSFFAYFEVFFGSKKCGRLHIRKISLVRIFVERVEKKMDLRLGFFSKKKNFSFWP